MQKLSTEGKTGKNYNGWKNSIIVMIATLFCLAAASITIHLNKQGTAKPKGDGYSIPRQVQYSFTLQNKSQRVIQQADLWTFAPVKQTAYQQCLSLQANYPYTLLSYDSGNQVLHFTFDNLAPYGTRVVTIKADLLLATTVNSSPFIPGPRDFKPQKYIESEHPEIKRLAHTLQGSDATKTIENAFRWVAGNVRYSGYAAKDRGARYALAHKAGDCTEYANLFVALCRANGIGARPIGGYVCPQNGVLRAKNYHNWVEFYQDGTWKLADPQNRVLMKKATDYIAMRVIHASDDDPMNAFNRFRFKGDGLKVRMN